MLAQCHKPGPLGHSRCRDRFKNHKTRGVPIRLIDVGHSQSSTIRLFEPPSTIKEVDYAILSYCWGNSNEPVKTTRANLSQRLQRIDTSTLPKTVQDAIILTQMIGILYLWVDDLCIIQSTPTDRYIDDWNQQADRMGSYYSTAYCLISALSTADSGEGLFTERLAFKYEVFPCTIGYDERTNSTSTSRHLVAVLERNSAPHHC